MMMPFRLRTLAVLAMILLAAASVRAVDNSFTAVGDGPQLLTTAGATVTYSVSGTFVGTVVLQQQQSGGWVTLVTATTTASGSFVAELVANARSAIYRFQATAYTSGTIVTSLTAVAGTATSNTFFTVSGPATTAKVFTFPNADATIAYDGISGLALTSPVLTTPTLGVATATSVNKMAITAPATSSTLAVANGKTATISNTLTFTGTDASTVAFGAGGTAIYSGGSPSFAATTNTSGSILDTSTPTSITSTSANSCGTTSPTFNTGSSNTRGSFNVGATSGTDCTITFSTAAAHVWVCAPSDETSAVLIRAVSVNTTTTKIQGVMTAADVVGYVCLPF